MIDLWGEQERKASLLVNFSHIPNPENSFRLSSYNLNLNVAASLNWAISFFSPISVSLVDGPNNGKWGLKGWGTFEGITIVKHEKIFFL